MLSIWNLPPAVSERLYETVSVPSASVARAVTPTAVPFAALSETELPATLLSETAPTEASDVSSVRLTEKLCVLVEPSSEVAVTVTECEVAVS